MTIKAKHGYHMHTHDTHWMFKYIELVNFVKHNKSYAAATDSRLGDWVSKQRNTFCEETLFDDQKT
jgi:hypothetical protein